MQDRLKQQWLALWQHIGGRGNAHEIYADLVARYAEPHRRYHTLAHIEQCLRELDAARHLAVNPDAVEMTLWYHDAVYDTRAKDNEEKSAELAAQVLKDASLALDFGHLVARLILATKHVVAPTDQDAMLVTDIDLSALGAPWETFEENGLHIREEYDWVPEAAFAAGRTAILKHFLARPSIYSTQFFCDKYEVPARRNIIRSLAQLSNRP